jgi:HlyD family secretion protein
MMNSSNNGSDHTDHVNGNTGTTHNEIIRVLIVDDQKMIREGLKALIKTETDLEVIGIAENGDAAIKQVEALQPDVVLMDMEMPGMDGMEATKVICQQFDQVKVLVLSTFDTQEYISRSLSSGAMGYLLKGTPAKELTDAIRSVHRGYAQIGPGIYQNLSLPQKQEVQKLPVTSSVATREGKSDRPVPSYPKGELVATGSGKNVASALARRDSSSVDPRKFEQQVILRPSPRWSRATVWGVIGVTVFAIGWSYFAKIEQVVPAQGQIQPRNKIQEIQVPTNGVVADVKVEEGDEVQKGEVLLVLDSTTSKAQVESLNKVRDYLSQENKFYRALMKGEINPSRVEETASQLNVPREVAFLTVNRAELKAENDMFQAQLSGGNGANLTAEQQARLRTSQAELNSRVAAAQLEVEQLERELNQNQVQLGDNREQLATAKQVAAEIKQRNQESLVQLEESLKIERETLASIEPLVAEGALSKLQADRQKQEVSDRIADLVEQKSGGTIELNNQQQTITSLQAEIQRLLEEEQRLRLDIAQAKEQLSNTTSLSEKDILEQMATNRKRIAEIDSQLNKTIVENDKRIAETSSQISGAEQNLRYQTIKAPVNGKIFDLKAYAGYVPPAGQASQPVLKIVPEDNLIAEVFIRPEDIGFVQPGMTVDVRISAFPYSEFGDVKGKVSFISKSALEPEPPYDFFRYIAKVDLDQEYIKIRGEDKPLQSGMSVQANIKVRENRTVMSLFTEQFFTGLDKFKEVR